jgi:hypothetical protein
MSIAALDVESFLQRFPTFVPALAADATSAQLTARMELNETIAAIVPKIKTQLKELIDMMKTIRMFVQLNVPNMEDTDYGLFISTSSPSHHPCIHIIVML